jgi:hypothetical protein
MVLSTKHIAFKMLIPQTLLDGVTGQLVKILTKCVRLYL